MTAENADENSGFEAGEVPKCVSQQNLPRAAVFSHPFVTKPQPFKLKDKS